jgi:hypothetical protein
MKSHVLTMALIWATSSLAIAQTPYSLVSSFPSNAATSVELSTTVRFTFNQPIPTHISADELDEFVDVSPRFSIEIHSSSLSSDRRSLLVDVTHHADQEYHWTVTGPYPIDQFHLLSYTTAPAFGSGSVSGQLAPPQDASLSTFRYGYVFLTPFSNVSFWDDVPRYAGIATLNADGTFIIQGVRPGTYYAYAIVTSDPANEETAAVYFGKNGQPIVVQTSATHGLTLPLQPIEALIPESHSHVKLSEARSQVTASFPQAALKNIVGIQSMQGGTRPNGSAFMWTLLWHDALLDKEIASSVSGYFIDMEEVDNDLISSLRTLPSDMISSKIAVQAALQEGGSAFFDSLPPTAMTFVMYMAGSDPSAFGYEGQVPSAPYWFIQFQSSFYENGTQVQKTHFALVDGLTGEIIDQTPTSIDKNPADGEQIGTFGLSQNYPNPFNPTTVVGYQLSVAGQTSIKVYDLLGREVAVLVDGVMPAGEHRVTFDATGLSSGVYLYRLQSGSQVETRRMTLVK